MNKFKKFSLPYLVWTILFTVIPLFLMIIFAISTVEQFSPYTFNFADFSINFSHFTVLWSNTFSMSLLRSFYYAVIATFLCLIIGYPIALTISKMKCKYKFLLLLLFILPMWTNMLLRIQTINNLLKPNSFLSNVFGFSLDLSNFKSLKIIIVMTFVYLPFMILPIYTILEKNDPKLLEASSDLGAGPIKSFFKVTLPMSLKGVFSGITMTFLPAAMGFTIPQIVTDGDPNYVMIGQLIERQFMSSWPQFNVGSLMSLVILIFILGSLFLISKVDAEGETLI